MKITHFDGWSATTYNENESGFIATLSKKKQDNIHRGLATPYDYGYKPEYTYFRIDGTQIAGTPLSRDEFIKKYYELETLIMDDTHEYYVLYEEENALPWNIGEYKEIFWCISASEIDFIYNKLKHIVGIVTPNEDYEEQYNLKLETYNEFERIFSNYILYYSKADESCFRLWKAFRKVVYDTDIADVEADNKFCLITWLENNWGAFLESILDGSFKYMNVAELVLNSWNEFCE